MSLVGRGRAVVSGKSSSNDTRRAVTCGGSGPVRPSRLGSLGSEEGAETTDRATTGGFGGGTETTWTGAGGAGVVEVDDRGAGGAPNAASGLHFFLAIGLAACRPSTSVASEAEGDSVEPSDGETFSWIESAVGERPRESTTPCAAFHASGASSGGVDALVGSAGACELEDGATAEAGSEALRRKYDGWAGAGGAGGGRGDGGAGRPCATLGGVAGGGVGGRGSATTEGRRDDVESGLGLGLPSAVKARRRRGTTTTVGASVVDDDAAEYVDLRARPSRWSAPLTNEAAPPGELPPSHRGRLGSDRRDVLSAASPPCPRLLRTAWKSSTRKVGASARCA